MVVAVFKLLPFNAYCYIYFPPKTVLFAYLLNENVFRMFLADRTATTAIGIILLSVCLSVCPSVRL